jgi:tetratricopeptide (TPR) repeat protein
MFLRDQGRMNEAMPEFRQAVELQPTSVMATINLAYALQIAGNTEGAAEMARRAAELNPELPVADVLLANIYRAHSNMGDVAATLERARALSAGDAHALSVLACVYAQLGRRAESLSLLHQIEQLAAQRYVSPFDLGNAALSVGDEDRAANWLEEAYREHSAGMLFLCREKSDSVMKSPRLRLLVQKIERG